jgi:hypothetical protein
MTLIRCICTFYTILFSLITNSAIIEEIEKTSPYFFSDIFDHGLYDLDHINSYDDGGIVGAQLRLSYEDSIQRLNRRKYKRINDTLIKDLDDYNTFITPFARKDAFEKLRRAICTAITTGGLLKSFSKASSIKSACFGMACACAIAISEVGFDYYFSGSEEDKKIALLKKRLIDKLQNEPIAPLEELYVQNRSNLTAKQRIAIEKALLNARKFHPMGSSIAVEDFVRDIISLPTGTLAIITAKNAPEFIEHKQNFLATTFPSLEYESMTGQNHTLDSPFYDKDVKRSLKSMLTKIIDHNFLGSCSQRGFIFYGAPGTGKTKAAELVAETLNLPFYRLSIIKSNDLDDDKLYGEKPSSYQPGGKGSLVQAFLASNKDSHPAQNVVILLDDIDRGFANPNSDTQDMQGLMNFLLKIFDINNTSIDANYYDIDIDFSHVIIIATMNRDIRTEKQFNALNSRCDFIDFKSPTKQDIKKNIKHSISDDMLAVSIAYAHNPKDWDTIRDSIADFILDSYDIDDNRQRQARALELSAAPKSEWQSIAERRQWKNVSN